MKETNEIIARWMGGTKQIIPKGGLNGYKEDTEIWMSIFSDNPDPITYLEFNSSWDWLMPVIEKIEKIHDSFHGYFAVYIGSNSCTIQGTNLRTDPNNPHYAYYNNVTLDTKINSVYEAILNFIDFYKVDKQMNNIKTKEENPNGLHQKQQKHE